MSCRVCRREWDELDVEENNMVASYPLVEARASEGKNE